MQKSITHLQDLRNQRAKAQADRYEVRRAVTAGADAGYAWWVINHADKKIYSVHNGVCSCPDFVNRCAGRGVVCKHVRLVEDAMGLDAQPEPLPEEAELAASRERARIDRDERGLWD